MNKLNTLLLLTAMALSLPCQATIINPGGGGGGSGITSINGDTTAAQTTANDTNITLSTSGGVSTLGWSGTLGVARGGTNSSDTPVLGGVVYTNATAHKVLAAGTSGQVLTSGGAGTPTWGAGGSGLTSLNAQTGGTQVYANDANVIVTSSNNTHSLGWASTLSLARGGTQAGLTAINGGIVYSDAAKLQIALAGTSGQYLKSNGAGAPTWGSGGSSTTSTQQIFTSGSGTYTTPANAKLLKVTAVGGGGSGGRCLNGTGDAASNGGGGGGTVIGYITSPSATYSYAVGAGGAGVTGSASTAGNASTFSTYSAGGGAGGNTCGTSTVPNLTATAAGGTSTGGNINITGGSSSFGLVTGTLQSAAGGNGGSSTLGGGGPGGGAQGSAAGKSYGGGGSGCTNLNNPGSTIAGGSGADGIIIVEESY